MDKIYFLQHFYEEENCDIVTDIAVYSTMEKAQKAINRFKKHPKFKKHPNCFNIDEYKIDEDNWIEGFISY